MTSSTDGGHSWPDDDDSLAPSGPYPPGVLDTAGLLSGDAATQRRALVPELVELLEEDGYTEPILPPRSIVRLEEDGWRSTIDGHGGAFGDVEYPGGETVRVNIGFSRVDGTWLVSYIAGIE